MTGQNSIAVADHDGAYCLRLEGELRCKQADALARFQQQVPESQMNSLLVDLSDVDFVDSTILGSLARVAMSSMDKTGMKPLLVLPEGDLPRLFESMGLYQVFKRTSGEQGSLEDLEQLSTDEFDEEELRQHVLSSHQTLVELKEENREIFSELLDELESGNSDKCN